MTHLIQNKLIMMKYNKLHINYFFANKRIKLLERQQFLVHGHPNHCDGRGAATSTSIYVGTGNWFSSLTDIFRAGDLSTDISTASQNTFLRQLKTSLK